MKRRTASCPSCGAPVIFPIGGIVAICDFCQASVGRGGGDVENYGKVADLIETSTKLQRGLTGKYDKKEFTIHGRVQYRHPAGGVWDEWYLALPGGRWAWLAEAQGQTYMMSEVKLKQGSNLPDFESMEVGTEIKIAGGNFAVKERGVAENASAEGDIPWAFRPGGEHQFVDMEDEQGRFATLEYGETPSLFVGQSVSLDDLNLVGQGWRMEDEKIATTAAQLNCPKCGGQLTVRAPGQTLRVTCTHCNSLLDAENDKLTFFKKMKSKEQFKIAIPLGSEGKLFGHQYTVIGFMRRYAVWEGKTFPWNEYLLYKPTAGFRWLVHNDRHWSFVGPPKQAISPGKGIGKGFQHNGKRFRIYDRGKAHVRYVIGEFYWKVEVGEKVRTADFIAPPQMISFEWSGSKKSEEVNISEGQYIAPEEIEKAFGVTVPRPWSVGVIQPYEGADKTLYIAWLAFAALLIILQLAFWTANTRTGADGWLCFYGLLMISSVPVGMLFYQGSFEKKRWENSDYSPYSME
jgi:ribosomal protein L37AE/L43A